MHSIAAGKLLYSRIRWYRKWYFGLRNKIAASSIQEQDHLRMNVAPDRTIILGLQIVLDHRSLSSKGQKILMILPPPLFQSK